MSKKLNFVFLAADTFFKYSVKQKNILKMKSEQG